MHFAYQGFTHDHDTRRFTFWGIEEHNPAIVFSIEINLPLLFENRVPVQEAPMFCLDLLTSASLAGPASLDKLRNYRVLESDLRPLLIVREKRAAEKAMKKPPRRPVRKPGSFSNIQLASSVHEH